MQKLVTNVAVLADRRGDLLYVSAQLFAQVCDLVYEADLQRQEPVRRILGKFSRLATDKHHRRIA